MRAAAAAAAALAAVLAAPVPTALAVEPAPAPALVLRLGDPRITESSGLAASARHRGVLWTHNDSGDGGQLFAVGPDGAVRGAYRLRGVQARDWEALAPGRDERGRPVLWVGDIGDNRSARERGILVHRVEEPGRLARTGTLPATSYRLRYPDGPRDAEALLADPRSGRLYVVTKALRGGVYAAPERLDPAVPNLLERVGDAPGLVTDGAFLPDGRVVLRDYGGAMVASGPGEEGEALALPEQPQGESLAAAPGGGAVLVGSEGARSAVYRVTLPGAGAATARPAAERGAAGDQGEGRAPSPWPPRRLLALALLVGVGAAGYRGVSRRRRR